MISKGEIPSFSFPLDTTTFAAEVKRGSRVSHLSRYSRDTKLALSELAPGQIRTVDGKKMKVGGLYFEYSSDRVNRAREFFDELHELVENRVSICLNEYCNWISPDKSADLTDKECPICRLSDIETNYSNVKTYRLLQPEGMAPICVPHDEGKPNRGLFSGSAGYISPILQKKTTKSGGRFSGRAKLPAPNVSASSGKHVWRGTDFWSKVSLHLPQTTDDGLGSEFVIINTGPDDEGFEFCQDCGASKHPDHLEKVSSRIYPDLHFRPYIIQGNQLSRDIEDEVRKKTLTGCSGITVPSGTDLPIGLGLRFRTDLIILRFDLNTSSFSFDWMTPQFHGASSAIRDSIQSTITKKLGIMNREIGSGYRRSVNSSGQKFIDFYFYDSVSGGAGLITQIESIKDNIPDILEESLRSLDGRNCLESKPCSRACVGCLLDFKNRLDHATINRTLGWSLFRFFKDGREPLGSDFGVVENVEINRLTLAVRSYHSFFGDTDSITQTSINKIKTKNGQDWEVISPLLFDNYEEKKIRIDKFEFFPDVITEGLADTVQRKSVFDY